MKDRLVSGMLAVIACGTPLYASAPNSEPVQICVEDWAPYHARNPNGDFEGTSVDILQQLSDLTGLNLQLVHLPALRCGEQVTSGKIPMAISYPWRSDKLAVSETPVLIWQLGAAVPAVSPITAFTALEQFSGRRILAAVGYPYPHLLTDWLATEPHVRYYSYGNDSDTAELAPFRLLERGRIDVIIEDLNWMQSWKAKRPMDIRVLEPAIMNVSVGLLYGPAGYQHRDTVEAALQTLGTDGIDQIFEARLGYSLSDTVSHIEQPH